MTWEILQGMGIKNAASIAVLLSAQEKLKKRRAGDNPLLIEPQPSPNQIRKVCSSFLPRKQKYSQAVYWFSNLQDGHTLSLESWLEVLPDGSDMSKMALHKDVRVSSNEDKSDARKRLEIRLDQFKLRKRNVFPIPHVESNRNCLFFAVSDQLFDTIERAQEVQQLFNQSHLVLISFFFQFRFGVKWLHGCERTRTSRFQVERPSVKRLGRLGSSIATKWPRTLGEMEFVWLR
jgi:hypothetical protein